MTTKTRIKPAFERDTEAEGSGRDSAPMWAGGYRYRDEVVPDPDTGMIEHDDWQRLVAHVCAQPFGRLPVAGCNVNVVDYGGRVGFVDCYVTIKVNGSLRPTELTVELQPGHFAALADVNVLSDGRAVVVPRGV